MEMLILAVCFFSPFFCPLYFKNIHCFDSGGSPRNFKGKQLRWAQGMGLSVTARFLRRVELEKTQISREKFHGNPVVSESETSRSQDLGLSSRFLTKIPIT